MMFVPKKKLFFFIKINLEGSISILAWDQYKRTDDSAFSIATIQQIYKEERPYIDT